MDGKELYVVRSGPEKNRPLSSAGMYNSPKLFNLITTRNWFSMAFQIWEKRNPNQFLDTQYRTNPILNTGNTIIIPYLNFQ